MHYTDETVRQDLIQTTSWRFPADQIGPAFDRWLTAHATAVAEATVRQHAQAVADTMREEFRNKITDLLAENQRLDAQIAKGGTVVKTAAELAAVTGVSLQQATESIAWTTDMWHQFKQAEHDRDAALVALAESRARFVDSEARRAELEAVIEKLKRLEELSSTSDWPGWNALNSVWNIIQDAPSSVVLADRDREVRARERELIAYDIENGVVEWDDLREGGLGTHWVEECVTAAWDSSGVWTDWLRRSAAALRGEAI